MPLFRHQTLRQLGYAIFETLGCRPPDARIVADHLVDSSLFGHDSHGMLRFYEYVDNVRAGQFDPTGEPKLVMDKPCTAVVDGGGAMGQVGAVFATKIAIAKARVHGLAAVTLKNTGHVGRVGAYPLMAARQGLMGLAIVNAGHLGHQIAPFGGIDGKLSTNPIAFAAPRRGADPIMVDMATSMVSEGKIRALQNRGQRLPDGWIIDHDGQPTTEEGKYLNDPRGAILPLGGASAHKGYCLSMMVELMGGALSGEGCAAGKTPMSSNGMIMQAYQIEHFTDLDDYYDQVESLARHVMTSRIDPDIGQIQLPGEPEFRAAAKHKKQGIPVDETTWTRICLAARTLKLDPAGWQREAIEV